MELGIHSTEAGGSIQYHLKTIQKIEHSDKKILILNLTLKFDTNSFA